MRHHKVLAKNFLLTTVTMLLLALGSSQSQAQITPTPPYFTPPVVPTVFDGLDWLTDRGGIVFDGATGSTTYGNLNVYPQRQGRNNVGPAGAPDIRLDPHRGLLRWAFPRTLDLNGTDVSAFGPAFTVIVDNPFIGLNKSDPTVFYDSSEPTDAISRWLGPGFIIPQPADRTAYNGFSFNFTPADPTNPLDPNPPLAAQFDYGYSTAVHNDFVVNRNPNPSGPATTAELAGMPNVDPAVYKAVHDVLVTEYKTQVHSIAQWTIGTQLNSNFPNPNPPPVNSLVPYDGQPNPPNPGIAPNLRNVKYAVDIYSPGSGTQIVNAGFFELHPNVQRAFVRVSWKNTVNTVTNVINPGQDDGAGGYVPGVGGVNDPVNSRIYMVDLNQAGWIHLGAPNAAPASFPYGGGTDQIVVTLFSVTPDDPNDANLYNYTALVTADACRFIEQDTPAPPTVPPTIPPVTNLGPLNDPLNPNTTFIAQSGRFLGPVVGTNKFTKDGSTLWYSVREEVVPSQVRIARDPRFAIDNATNPPIIDPSAVSTAPVFYCLTNENNIITKAVALNPAVVTTSKQRVVWRYVGFPDGGSATAFASPVIANVRGRDGKYHVMVYFCSTSNTELNGTVGRIYALDALGDTNPDTTMRTTVTTAYWTYPSLRPIEIEEIPAPVGTQPGTLTYPSQYHDPNYTHGFLPGLNPPADPENRYSINDPTHYNNSWAQGYWWNADQQLFSAGSKQYYDGDVVQSTDLTKPGYMVKADTQIIMGGITGAPVVMDDPGNSTGPMMLVVPSIDGRLYAFDAGGRGDFNTGKTLPVPAADPNNPTLPAGTLSTLGVTYTIPGTTQRLWAWPHWSADAFHQIYDMAGSVANAGVANTFVSEDSKGAMPYSPSYDSTFGQDDPRSAIIISAGNNGENGDPGQGHVYGLLPLHDAPVYIGQNNTPIWTVIATGGAFTGTADRRYWSFPKEGDRATDPSNTPLLDIPGVPTIYTAENGGFIYFPSHGRIYSLTLPNALPGTGHYTPDVKWIYPHTPLANIPYQDPNDSTTFEKPQGFAPKGLTVLPSAVCGIRPDGTSSDTVYALLTDGEMVAIEALPAAPPGAYQTNFIAQGTTPVNSFTESAPILTAIARDPFLDASARPTPGMPISLTTSVPALLFADSLGNTYALAAQPRVYNDGFGGTVTKLPLIYGRADSTGQIATPPALVASTRSLAAGSVPIMDAGGHLLNQQPYLGGYFVVGDTFGQLRAYSLGSYANGYGDTAGDERQESLGGPGQVSIDIREFDAYTNYAAVTGVYRAREFNGIAPNRGQTGAYFTPGRKEDDTKYDNTATPIKSNIPAANPVGIALDQGGNLYLAASGVYHAQPQDNSLGEYGTSIPTIRVTFQVSQNGLPVDSQIVTVTPVTPNPNNKGAQANLPWPDDLAILPGDKNNLHIYGVDNNNPSANPNPTGDGSDAQLLTGPAQNVYPWAAKKVISIIPRNVGGLTTYGPSSSGYTVSVHAEIVQSVHLQGTANGRTQVVSKSADMTLGQRYAAGLSKSEFPPDINDPSIYQSAQRSLFITNPLGLTVRGYLNTQDMTGNGPKANPNMIGWAGPIDSPLLGPGGVINAEELTGNGSYVGVGQTTPATGGGYIKPLYAPFGMAQDNSSISYLGDTNGTRNAAIFLMDRSDLKRVTGQPVKVRTRISPFSWSGTATSVLNPLPFDQLPDRGKNTVDYPALDASKATFKVDNVDATQTVAILRPPTNTTEGTQNVDPSQRLPVPTPVQMSLQIAKYFPANVNRGQIQFNFRGTKINFGDAFTDMAGYARGYNNASGSPALGTPDTNPIVGPLDTNTGLPLNLLNSTPSGGYIGNVSVTIVPQGAANSGVTTRTGPGVRGTNGPAGLGGIFRASSAGVIDRIFQTGVCVAPAFRMRVLETTLDMGKVPHGTGYSDLVGGNYLYRFPFSPTGTGSYQAAPTGANPNGQIFYSPWDNDNQLTAGGTGIPGLATPTNIQPIGRFFRPFTWINDSNVSLVSPRVGKLIGSHSADASANPNLGDVISNASLSVNPGYGIANSVRLNSDQVNNLLSPPLFAMPFGQSANFLGNIGIVSSFDHDSYAQSIMSEVNLYPMLNPAVDSYAVQQSKDLFSLGLLRAAWPNVGIQTRPTIHKPRPGDGNGTVATIPDQPHDYQFAAQNNNSGTSGFYQSEVAAGLFTRPSMGIAVPLGTPVGTYSATIYPYEDSLPIQWLEWLATTDPKNSGTQALGNEDGILNTNIAGQPVEPYANPAPILKLTVQENRLTNGNTTGVMPHIDIPYLSPSGYTYDPLSFNLQPAALMIPDTSVNLRNSIWLYWTTNRVLPGSKFGTTLNGSTFPNPNAPINIAYSSLNTPYANLNGYIRGDSGFTGHVPPGGLLPPTQNALLPQWWGLSGNTASFNLLPGYTDKDTPDKTALLFNNNGINPATARYASPAVTLATRFDRTTGTYPVDPEAYEVHQGSVELLRQGNNSTPLAFQQTLTRTFYSSLNGQTPGAPDYAAAGAVDGMFAFDNDPALPKLSPHPLLVKIQTGAANVGTKFLYVFWHSGVQGRSALYYNVNVQTKGLNQGFDATTPAAGNTPGTGFALLGDAKLDTPAALSWQSDPYPVYRHVVDPTTNTLVDAIDVMYTGVLKNRQTVEILISRYRIVETAQPANGSQPALQVGQLTPIPFPTVHQDLLSRIPGTNTWAARDAGWFLPPDSQNADTAANRFMRISLMPANNNNSYPINALENNLGTQRGKVDPATGQVYFNAVAIDKATSKIAVDAANRPIFGGGQIVVDPKAGTVSFPNIPPKNTDTVLASYTPYLIRVNTARDDFNIDRDTMDLPGVPSPYGNGQFQSLLAKFRPNVVASGQNYAPTYVMDRAPNSRVILQSPQVIYNMNNVPYVKLDKNGQTNIAGPPIDRKWILYRKSDVDNKIKTVYMKTQRLMARLPRPVALSAVNGTNTSPLAAQVISNLTVQRFDQASNSFMPLNNVYEVDWVRGRVYFQEEDEGDVVQISYTYYDPVSNKTGQSGNLYYRVDWGDEINSTFSPYDTSGKWIGYDSTQEVQMPSNSTVNEGAVTAFKDSYIDKLWIFWSSTRAGAAINGQTVGTTDLYYETLAPQFYPTASNQY